MTDQGYKATLIICLAICFVILFLIATVQLFNHRALDKGYVQEMCTYNMTGSGKCWTFKQKVKIEENNHYTTVYGKKDCYDIVEDKVISGSGGE